MPLRARVQVVPQWHKTAFKFHRIRCTICLTSPDNHQEKKTTPESRVPASSLYLVAWHMFLQKLQWKWSFWLFGQASHWQECIPKDSLGQPERQDISEKAQNGKASCCTLRKRITKLKCVNSEVNSVDIDPNWSCLNWPYGTMSESP